MPEYKVAVTGLESVDSLHALGLGATLATVTRQPVHLERRGIWNVLTAAAIHDYSDIPWRLQDLIELPSGHDLERFSYTDYPHMDGILATAITSVGVRAVSMADIKDQGARLPDVIPRAISKAKSRIARLERDTLCRTGASKHWVVEMLKDYEETTLKTPVPVRAMGKALAVSIPFEPAFGFASRRYRDDGLLGDGTNLQFEGTRFADTLLHIGAARYLRGQRVHQQAVLLTVPVANTLLIQPDAKLPTLSSSAVSWRRALLLQWLRLWKVYGNTLDGISYQVLQPQGAKQSISIRRGYLPYSLLSALPSTVARVLRGRWISILARLPVDEEIGMQETLTNFLMSPSQSVFWAHILSTRWKSRRLAARPFIEYNLEEVISVLDVINSVDTTLASIRSQEAGTVRFGRSLRLVGNYKPFALRDIISDLECVGTIPQLLTVLAKSTQLCVLAKAQTEAIIVPSEQDVWLLLDDVAKYGLQEVVALLTVLSVVRYPSSSKRNAMHSITRPPGEMADIVSEEEANYDI